MRRDESKYTMKMIVNYFRSLKQTAKTASLSTLCCCSGATWLLEMLSNWFNRTGSSSLLMQNSLLDIKRLGSSFCFRLLPETSTRLEIWKIRKMHPLSTWRGQFHPHMTHLKNIKKACSSLYAFNEVYMEASVSREDGQIAPKVGMRGQDRKHEMRTEEIKNPVLSPPPRH